MHEVIIQRLMHHCSVESQKIYTAPERKELTKALKEAQQKLAEQVTLNDQLTVEDWLKEQ